MTFAKRSEVEKTKEGTEPTLPLNRRNSRKREFGETKRKRGAATVAHISVTSSGGGDLGRVYP